MIGRLARRPPRVRRRPAGGRGPAGRGAPRTCPPVRSRVRRVARRLL